MKYRHACCDAVAPIKKASYHPPAISYEGHFLSWGMILVRLDYHDGDSWKLARFTQNLPALCLTEPERRTALCPSIGRNG